MPRYSKRHYNEIARLLHDFSYGDQNATLCEVFAGAFARDNPRFQTTKWYAACRKVKW